MPPQSRTLLQLCALFRHRSVSAPAACVCTPVETPAASSATSAVTPLHSHTLSLFWAF